MCVCVFLLKLIYERYHIFRDLFVFKNANESSNINYLIFDNCNNHCYKLWSLQK